MSTPVEPLRLLLLADTPEWAALLRECLVPMGDGAVLISAPNWDSVSRLFDDDHSAVLLTTPNLQPGPALQLAVRVVAGTGAVGGAPGSQ